MVSGDVRIFIEVRVYVQKWTELVITMFVINNINSAMDINMQSKKNVLNVSQYSTVLLLRLITC